MFIAALFTKAKICKQPKCPLTEEWTKKMWYIYNGIHKKKNEIMPFAATRMQLEITVLTQKEKDKYHTIPLICRI